MADTGANTQDNIASKGDVGSGNISMSITQLHPFSHPANAPPAAPPSTPNLVFRSRRPTFPLPDGGQVAVQNVTLDAARARPDVKVFKLAHRHGAASRSAHSVPPPVPAGTKGDGSPGTPNVRLATPDYVDDGAASASAAAESGGAVDALHAASAPAPAALVARPALPLLRGREKLALLRQCPLFSRLPEAPLLDLCSLAVERSLRKYQLIHPSQSFFLLVHGGVKLQQHGSLLTGPRPTELLSTAPTPELATAAAAVAFDCAVAERITEPGSTIGVAALVGGLCAALRLERCPAVKMDMCARTLASTCLALAALPTRSPCSLPPSRPARPRHLPSW